MSSVTGKYKLVTHGIFGVDGFYEATSSFKIYPDGERFEARWRRL